VISVIIPTYNEQESIGRVLECLRAAPENFEVLVADGASGDLTRVRVEALMEDFPHPLRVLSTGHPRARQLNRAARAARGDVFLFLYADTLLPPGAMAALQTAAGDARLVGGNFDLVFEGGSAWDGFFTWVNGARRRLGIYYGDSGIWVRREVFERMGGFKPLPIMDDYEFARRLERQGKTACLAPPLGVSDRRWRVQGVWTTLMTWAWIHTLYSLGVPARHLARFYKPVREAHPHP
jgi:rSAM/selenodomain-associated transferase 2